MYEDWKANPEYWYTHFYGKYTDRKKLRGLIYDYRPYYEEFKDMQDYDLIFLSLNFDTYPMEDFSKFVKAVIIYLYWRGFLTNQEVIIGAGNEIFEKRQSAEKVVRTTWDTKMGILNSVNPNIEVCSWNEKIRTSEEKKAFEEVLNNQQHKSVCKYVGYQSLETEPEIARQFIRLAQVKGYEVVDVECGTTTNQFSEIKMKFENNQLPGIDKVFFITPYISRELANYDENFKNYALQILRDNGTIYQTKPKYALIEYVQQFKTFTNGEQEEVMNKMLDDIIFGVIYKVGTRGIGVKRIQKICNLWLDHKDYEDKKIYKLAEDGLFGIKTKETIIFYQLMNDLAADGIAGRETLTYMLNFMLKRYYK